MALWESPRQADTLPINPPASLLGSENAILTGTGTRYCVPDFEGCLSIKTIIAGAAVWEAGGRRFTVHENCYLILNDRRRYTITIDSLRKVTTFCLFFERGFVEDVYRASAAPEAELLDSPQRAKAAPVGFFERIEPGGPVLKKILALRQRVVRGETSRAALNEGFFSVAEALVREHHKAAAAAEKLPALRSSTREELYRRLLRGRDFLLSSLDSRAGLNEAARAACLSPFHFHRSFAHAFGATPHQYLTRYRLERASQLLRRTSRSVTEICLDAGFESPGSFSTLFRRHFGCAPSQFRSRPAQIRDQM